MQTLYRLLLALLPQLAFAQGIVFDKAAWPTLLATAKAQNKLLYVDVYTTWCGPCKRMEQQVFPDKAVGQFYNGHFINVKLDAERPAGQQIASKYGVQGFPTGLYINGNGELVHTFLGGRNADMFLAEGETAFRKTGPGNVLLVYEQAYADGNRHPDVMRALFQLRRYYGRDNTGLLEDYLSHLPADSLTTPTTLQLTLAHAKTASQTIIDVLMANRQDGRVANKLTFLYDNELETALTERGEKRLNQLFGAIRAAETPERATELIASYQLQYVHRQKQWTAYAEQAEAYARQHLLPHLTADGKQAQPERFQRSYDQLCNLGWVFYREIHDANRLALMRGWIEQANALQESPASTGICACLLYRTGDRAKAIDLQSKALELARKDGLDSSSYEQTLKRMQKGKGL